MLRGAEETTAQLAFLFSTTTPWQQAQALGAFPERHFQPRFSNLRTWEERGGRGGSTLVAPGMGERVEGGRPRAAMDGGLRARGKLTGGTEREGCGLGMV